MPYLQAAYSQIIHAYTVLKQRKLKAMKNAEIVLLHHWLESKLWQKELLRHYREKIICDSRVVKFLFFLHTVILIPYSVQYT